MKSLFEGIRMANRMPRLLVRYGELGLKSPNVRRRFEQALVFDIRRKHALARVPCIISTTRGRVFVDSDDWKKSMEILSRTFGVVSFSPVSQYPSSLEELVPGVLAFSEPLMFKGATLAVRTRRTGNHPYSSQSLAAKLGEELLRRFSELGVSVDLEEPDVEVNVEVREKEAYVYSTVVPGPGGMPKGTQGRVLSELHDERGLGSSWLMMKRGCNLYLAVSGGADPEPLRAWDPDLKTLPAVDDLIALAKENDCAGLALSHSLKGIEDGGAVKGDLPVFYPLVGMTQEEVDALLDRIRR